MSRAIIQCVGKQAFQSAALAKQVAKRVRSRRKGTQRPPDAYRCDCCRQWHIGGSDY